MNARYLEVFAGEPEPEALIEYLKRRTPFTRNSMLGATIRYRLPVSTGWIVLTGTVVNVTDTAIVVREKHLGGKSTIDPTWFVSYVWERKTPTSELVSVS